MQLGGLPPKLCSREYFLLAHFTRFKVFLLCHPQITSFHQWLRVKKSWGEP